MGSLTSSGIVSAIQYRIQNDNAAAFTLLSGDQLTEFGGLGHVAAATEYFSDSLTHDIIIRNCTPNSRILLGNGAGRNALGIMTPSSFFVHNGNILTDTVNITTYRTNPNVNSTTLSWSWQNSDGRSYLINQRGSGVGGLSFGMYDLDTSTYTEYLGVDARFSSTTPLTSITTVGGSLIVNNELNAASNVKTSAAFKGAFSTRYIDTSSSDVNTSMDDYMIIITNSPADPATHRVVVQPMSGASLTVSKTIYLINGSNNTARVGCQPSYATWNGAASGYSDLSPGVMIKVIIYPSVSSSNVVACLATIVDAPQNLYVNAAGFGALGNGINDDTAALRNAFNFMKGQSACEVFIPAGVYKITGVLPIPNHVTVTGAGIQRTIIRPLFTTSFDGVFVSKIMYDNHPVGSQTVGFKNITIQQLTVDIFANHVNPKNNVPLPYYTFTNGCFWFYPPNTGDFTTLLADSARRCKNLTIDHVEVIGGPYFYSVGWTDRFGRAANGNWNFNLGGIDTLTITNCVLQGSGRDTLNIKACNNVTISHNIIFDSEDDSIAIGDFSESNWYFNPAYGGEMTTYTFNGSIGGYDALIHNNIIKQGSAYGIKIFKQSNIIISNNIFKDINQSAIALDSLNCEHVTVQGNTAQRIGNYALSVLNSPSGGTRPLVIISGANHSVTHLMVCNNTVTTGANILSCPATATGSYVIVTSNTIKGSGTAVSTGSGTFDHFIFNNNMAD